MSDLVICLKPLEDVMERNNIYLLLRDTLGCPEPPQANLLHLKVADETLQCESTLIPCMFVALFVVVVVKHLLVSRDEELVVKHFPGWGIFLSGDDFERRIEAVQVWNDSLSGVVVEMGEDLFSWGNL